MDREGRTKRIALALLGTGYLGLLIDAWIAHQYSGGGIDRGLQYVPLVFPPLAFVTLGVAPAVGASLRWTSRIVGSASIAVGLVGVFFHLQPVVEDLDGEALTFGAVMGALGSGPPLLAPAAFAALGALVVAVGAPSVRLSVELERRPPVPALVPEVQTDRVEPGRR